MNTVFLWLYDRVFFSFQNNPKNLDMSYKTDLLDCLGRVNVVMYITVYWWPLPPLYVGQVYLTFYGCRVYFVTFFMENPVSNPNYVASDLGLHYLPMTLFWISR